MECVVGSETDCELKVGSPIRIYDEKPAEKETKTVAEETTAKQPAPAPKAEPAPAPVPEPVAPSPAPVKIANLDVGVEPPQLTETLGVAQDITAAADAAQSLGGDYAPMVAIALAGMAVAGGSKAWSYYRDRAEQKHEQEMQKLKIEAQSKGMDGQQPPACQAATQKMQAELDEVKSKLSAVQKKTSMISADFDGEDVERQIKRMKKRIDELFEITEQK